MSEETKAAPAASKGFVCGLIGLICSIIGIFFLAIIFVPLGLILGIIATVKKSYALGISAIVLGIVAFFTSPTLLLLFGLGSLKFF
jgi:hypothetical protein